MRLRQQLIERTRAAMADVDVMVCAAAPGVPTPMVGFDRDAAFKRPSLTMPFNLTGNPAMSVCSGYGMGAAKFQAQLKNFGVDVELDEAKRIIDTYRRTYPKIAEFWKTAGKALDAMLANQSMSFGRDGVLQIDGHNGIRLPNAEDGLPYLVQPPVAPGQSHRYCFSPPRHRYFLVSYSLQHRRAAGP